MNGSQLWRSATDENFLPLAVEAAHLESLESLPRILRHGDPFDHLLLAQARAEGAVIMTNDAKMVEYGIPCIGVR
jgi:PIN domain nuclease of toxin-antitoxin system